MPSLVVLSSVFRLALKCCVVLSITCIYLGIFFYKFRQFAKMIFMFLLCVLMLHFRGYFSKTTTKKTSGVIIVCSWLEKVSFIFYWKEMIGDPLTEHRRDMHLRRCKQDGYVAHWKVAPNLLWHMKSETFCSLTSFKSCIHSYVCIMRHF